MKRKRDKKLETQRRFIFRSVLPFNPVRREQIYDAAHIFPQIEPIIDYLKNYRLYKKMGIPISGGLVIWGPAGTGKTTFARYIATEARARFINVKEFPTEIKGGDERWQPKDIRTLFSLAAEWVRLNNKPLVLFMDQFDDWLKLNGHLKSEIETELDGFSQKRNGVFVIATAKKKPEEKDDENEPFSGSILRAGRLGIHIALCLPDRKQQIELLRGFLSEYPHENGIDIENIVYLLDNPSPADIKEMVSEAHRIAQQDSRRLQTGKRRALITENCLIKVFLSKLLDPPTGYNPTEEFKARTRVHELGHYIVFRAWGLPARVVCARPGIESWGTTFELGDQLNPTVEELRRTIAALYGGGCAENLLGFEAATGVEGDLKQINELAQQVANLERSKLLKGYGDLEIDRHDSDLFLSQGLIRAYERELGKIMSAEEKRARSTLKFFGASLIRKIAEVLSKKPHEVMLQKELDALLQPKLAQFHKQHRVKDHIIKN